MKCKVEYITEAFGYGLLLGIVVGIIIGIILCIAFN